MLNKRLIVLIVFTAVLVSSCMRQPKEYIIYETERGREISLKRLATETAAFDVVIFGEFHGNDIIHDLQARFLPEFAKINPNVVVSLEMFERDVQKVVDDYLEGKISEQEFIEKGRGWSNYPTDYRPLIEFAKGEQLPVIASNVPRRIAASVARFGIEWLNNIPAAEREYIASEVKLTDDSYRDRFFGIMADSRHIDDFSQDVLQNRLENLYAAQSLKDDTMAESIATFLSRDPEAKIVHFNGDFHSQGRLGVVTKLLNRKPNLKIAVISPILIPEGKKLKFHKDMRNNGDYVLVIREYK